MNIKFKTVTGECKRMFPSKIPSAFIRTGESSETRRQRGIEMHADIEKFFKTRVRTDGIEMQQFYLFNDYMSNSLHSETASTR